MNAFPVVIDRKDSQVSIESTTLVIRTPETTKQTIPLHLISQLIIHGKPSVESDVWRKLAENNITAVIFPLKGKGDPAFLGAGLVNSLPMRFSQYNCYQNPDCRQAFAHQLIYLKYLAQQHTLKQFNDSIEGQTFPIEPMPLNKLLGLEGTLARCYFAQIKKHIEPKWSFHGRNRQPPKDPLNALMSLSYTLLVAVIQRVIQQTGLDPWLGLYHEPYPGRPALAVDLIEPMRPEIDLWLMQRLEQDFSPEDFTHSELDGCKLAKEARWKYYQHWANFNATTAAGNTLEQQCRRQLEQLTDFLKNHVG